jgi:hypothetical protein
MRDESMPQYVIEHTHPPDNCPLTNKAVREFMKQNFPKHPEIGRKLGVKKVWELHLDPDHKAITLLEAPTAEAVRDFLVQGGYMHFTDMRFHLVTPVEELIKHADEMPTIF